MTTTPPPSDDTVCLLIEILSCQNLMIRDKRAKSSDPYVKVKLGNKDVHQTKTIIKNLNPTFTDAQNNSFLLDCSAKELFDHKGLLFKAKDWNRLSSDEDLGMVLVPAMDLYKATGEPMVFDLEPPSDVPKGTNVGRIALRCWPATEAHLKKFGKSPMTKGLRGFVSGIQNQAQTSMAATKEGLQDLSSKVLDMPSSAMELAGKISTTPKKLHMPHFGGSKKDDELLEQDQSSRSNRSNNNNNNNNNASSSAVMTNESNRSATKKATTKDEKSEIIVEGGDEDEPGLLQEEEEKPKAVPAPPPPPENLKILIEIVAGRQLLIGDVVSSDPYVKVMLGKKEIHKTKHLLKTLDPVFTPELDSTFLLECTSKELLDSNGLKFVVKDWDRIGSNDELGHVDIACQTLKGGQGDAMEFMIIPPQKREKEEAGYLLIRFRPATSEDEHALQEKHKKNLFANTTKQAAAAAWGLLPDSKHAIQQTLPKTVDDAEISMSEKTNTPKKAAEEYVAQAMETDQTKAGADQDVQPKLGEELHLKIEVVSCRGLLIADKTSSDPYVKIAIGDKNLHKTKHVVKTLNPVYSEDTNNVFVLHCLATDLFEQGGLTFKVKDWDRIGKDDELGSALVPAKDIYMGSHGKDMEYKLTPPKGRENEDAGYITIRSSVTSEDDHSGEKKTFLGIKAPQIKAPQIKVPHIKSPAALFINKRGNDSEESEEPQPLFIEIMSCKDLLAADKTGFSDPYVKVKMGRKDLHQTKYVNQTLNPVYSAETNSYFILDESPKDVRANGGLVFKIKDWDRVGKDDDLGQLTVDADTLYGASGEPMELVITPPKGHGEAAGFLTIRCRPATETDKVKQKGFLKVFSKAMAPLKDYGPVDLSLLVEVVSCWHLPIADLNSSDPYVKISIGPRLVHETKKISNTRDPIFTIAHDSLFILDVATKEIQENGGVIFKVKDYDFVGKNDELGTVVVPADEFLEASGERLEFPLSKDGNQEGFIAIRCRPATNYDREFLLHLQDRSSSGDFLGLTSSYKKAMEPFGGSGLAIKKLFKKMQKEEMGVKKFRVRPYPDPDAPEATEFMSEKQIMESEAYKESKKWLDVGSGDLGKVYVEIIGADGLPNKDHDLGTGNKTDSFVSVVYEDCIAKTDVIDDCLSPRWLPWTQRAFIFRMMHTSSNLHVAVFDYDAGFSNGHDMCGRVSIDLANLNSDVEYLLNYNLYESSAMANREPVGVIILRIRMELKSEKERILSNLQLPPEFYVNVKTRKDFDLVRQTIGGRHDLTRYSTKTIQLYVDELMEFKVLQLYAKDAIVCILFWRPSVPVPVLGFKIPLHSMYFFYQAITLAERPSLYPSFFFLNLAWFLIAMQWFRNNAASPWFKTKTFPGLFSALVTGKMVSGPPSTIIAHQNEKEAEEESQKRKERVDMALKEAEESAAAQMKLYEEHESMLAEVGEQQANTNMSTETGGVSIDPLKFILYPIQQYLALAVTSLRFVKNIMIWDEPYIAFLLTAGSMIIGVVFWFMPWAFLIRWISRIVAWLVFGPHMKLVDIYWYSKVENLTRQERIEQIRDAFTGQLEAARALAAAARIQRENVVKMKQIKQALYGRFVTRVPVLRTERFPDIPLYASNAKPYDASAHQKTRAIPERISGQHLVGTMIPRVIDDDAVATADRAKTQETKKND